jgi:alpha-tubulin suppressor-like RCC1 family protein
MRRALRRVLLLASISPLASVLGCSALGLFDAAPAVPCLSDTDCHVAGLVEDACTHYVCDTARRLCVGSLTDHDADGQAAVGCATSPFASTGTPTDCDDTDGVVYAGAQEICSGTDTDCDGTIDESCVTPQLSVGGEHSCYRAGADVVCWGGNTSGELGIGSIESTSGHPRRVSGLDGATSVVAGWDNTCATMSDGRVLCWGNDDAGQLGLPPTPSRRVVPTEAPALQGIVQISLGNGHGCGMLHDDVVCWGRNINGQLGDGTITDSFTPVTVPGTHGALAVSAGNGSSCAVLADHTIACWGGGTGTPAGCVMGTLCPVVEVSDAVDVGVGGFHACAVRASGNAICWGANDFGQLGWGTPPPHPWGDIAFGAVPDLLRVGPLHNCLLSAGQVWCWGNDAMGQVSGQASGATSSITRVFASVLGDAIDVGTGATHTCALRIGGEVLCWGNNFAGQLGVPVRPMDLVGPQLPLSTWVHDGRP